MKKLFQKLIKRLAYGGALNWMSDERYLKLLFWASLGYRLNLKNPRTYNEKLQWLKLYDHNDIYTKMVDKYEAKKYVAEIIGEEYIIPTLGVWNSFDEIDFDSLPEQFVLKCTHDSGGLVICRDKNSLDMEAARKKIEKSLKTNYFKTGREWPYKNVKPRIIAEKYMEDHSFKELRDYKIFTFNAVAKALFISSGRQTGNTSANYYDIEFKHLDLTWGYPHIKGIVQKPESFDKMVQFAEKIASGTKELRVDFYEVDGKAYFGEITFFDGSGFDAIEPIKWDYIFGEWLSIPIESGGGTV